MIYKPVIGDSCVYVCTYIYAVLETPSVSVGMTLYWSYCWRVCVCV